MIGGWRVAREVWIYKSWAWAPGSGFAVAATLGSREPCHASIATASAERTGRRVRTDRLDPVGLVRRLYACTSHPRGGESQITTSTHVITSHWFKRSPSEKKDVSHLSKKGTRRFTLALTLTLMTCGQINHPVFTELLFTSRQLRRLPFCPCPEVSSDWCEKES